MMILKNNVDIIVGISEMKNYFLAVCLCVNGALNAMEPSQEEVPALRRSLRIRAQSKPSRSTYFADLMNEEYGKQLIGFVLAHPEQYIYKLYQRYQQEFVKEVESLNAKDKQKYSAVRKLFYKFPTERQKPIAEIILDGSLGLMPAYEGATRRAIEMEFEDLARQQSVCVKTITINRMAHKNQ